MFAKANQQTSPICSCATACLSDGIDGTAMHYVVPAITDHTEVTIYSPRYSPCEKDERPLKHLGWRAIKWLGMCICSWTKRRGN